MTDEETEWIVEWPAGWEDVEWTEEDIQEFFDKFADKDYNYRMAIEMRDDTWETTEDGAWEYDPEYVDEDDLEEGVCGKYGEWLSGRGDGSTMSRHCDECEVMVAIY